MIDMNVSEYTCNLLGCISVFYRISPQIIEKSLSQHLVGLLRCSRVANILSLNPLVLFLHFVVVH